MTAALPESRCERCGREYRPLRRGYCKSCDMSRRNMIGYECSYVDAEPVRIHIKNLTAAGVGSRRIHELTGVARSTIRSLVAGKSRNGHREPPTKRVSKDTADRILAIPMPDPGTTMTLVADGAPVPSVGTVRRMQALVAAGYTRSYLANRLGVQQSNASHLFDSTTTHVLAETARRVDALFRELQLTPGPSLRARNDGRRRNWPLPMEWDEDTIDNPDAQPERSRRTGGYDPKHDPERIAERQKRVEALTRAGYSAQEIATQLGVTSRTVVRDRGALSGGQG